MANDINGMHVGQWLNPRRKLHAETVLAYLWSQCGGKMHVQAHHYRSFRELHGLEPYQVDTAIDDLYAVRAVELRAPGGGVVIVQAVMQSMEECMFAPPAAREPVPKLEKLRRKSNAFLAHPAWRANHHG